MDTIYLFTRQWFFYERLKSLAKLVLGRPAGGPEAVIASLERGLPELGQNYIINNSWRGEAELAVVLTGAKTLKWAIGQKNKGKIKHLVAGPDVGMPKDNRGLIFDPAIDIFLLPSPWVVEFCSSFNPAFKNKARVWAAGVETLPASQLEQPRHEVLIYQKNIGQNVLEAVYKALDLKNVHYKVICYGRHSHSQYLENLKAAKAMIFLSASESQGIALNEAWMCNVPTLVYNGGHLKTQSYEWAKSSPAPYLNDQSGMFFKSADDFAQTLELFMNRLPLFTPRLYHEQNFTDRICAEKFLNIIQEIKL